MYGERKMAKWRALILAGIVLTGCSKGQSADPVVFLPRQVSADGVDLEKQRQENCHGRNVNLSGETDELLTSENFRAVFACANYDRTLSPLEPLFTNEQFPAFLKNINVIIDSNNTSRDIKETLRDWLEIDEAGSSRGERLLPVLASVIKNPSFQDALPLLSSILSAGQGIWESLLPSLADVLYQERFPDNFDDIFTLFESADAGVSAEKNYSKTVKEAARFLQKKINGESVALRTLELADDLRKLKMKNTSIQEYLDQMNEKGVFVSLFLESGAVRGEQIDPKLNAEKEPGDDEDGLVLTPEQRRVRNYKKLFARGPNGEVPPIMELIGLVDEFQKAHPDFIPALGRWFAANGTRSKLTDSLTQYVVRGQIASGLPEHFNISSYLGDYADEKEIDTDEPMTEEEFVSFLKTALGDAKFSDWIDPILVEINEAQIGKKNAKILAGSSLLAKVKGIYGASAVSEAGRAVYANGAPKSLNVAIRRFSNSQLEYSVALNGKTSRVQDHLLDAWWEAASEALGESVIVDFAFPLVQSLVTKITTDFKSNGKTISEWYFSSPYVDPSTVEMISSYAFRDLGMMEKYHKHRDYLINDLADEIFKGGFVSAQEDANNKRAYRALVAQVPNIWLYWRSGMSRSGNDLTRAMASKDKGYLIKNYVAILVSAYQTGFAEKAVDLLSAYQNSFSGAFDSANVSDELEDRRKVSLGADALKRVLRSLFRPESAKNYETSTLGRLLVPLSSLVSDAKRAETERFLLTSAGEVLATPEEKINDFFRDFGKNAKPANANLGSRRETLRSVSDVMRKDKLPTMVRQMNSFFQDNAIRPALNYLAEKIDDGTLKSVLLFLRRVLGFRG